MIKSYFSNIRTEIINNLKVAKKEINIAIYWFTNRELFYVLLNKLDEGVNVHLIIHNDFINNRESGLPFQDFIDRGGKFYFSDEKNPMHNKFCLIDNKVLINGSYNWTYYAEEKNRENVLIIDNENVVTDSFFNEFQRLIKLSNPLDKINSISKFEIGINDTLNHKEYLAKDLLFKAKKESNTNALKQALSLDTDNISVQKLADDLNLIKKKKIAFDVGLSIIDDGIKYLAKKGDKVPSTYTTIVRTNYDDQTKSITKIVYGNYVKASDNKIILKFVFNEIPKLPKGQAKLKFTFSIDMDGYIIVELLCLTTGKKMIKKTRNLNLIAI